MIKKNVPHWWQKDCSIVGLYNELIKDNKTTNYIEINDGALSLIFHDSYRLKVLFKGSYFYTYINDQFDCYIEEQDIYEYLLEIVHGTYIFIEYNKKMGFFKKYQFHIVPKEKFILLNVNRKHIKRIFTVDKVLFEQTSFS